MVISEQPPGSAPPPLLARHGLSWEISVLPFGVRSAAGSKRSEPPCRASGPASQASRRAPQGLRAGQAWTRRPASHPTLSLWPASLPSSRPCLSGERSALQQSSRDRCSLQSRAWTGASAALRTAGRLSPAGLRLATSTTLTVAVRSGRRSQPSRASLVRKGGRLALSFMSSTEPVRVEH